MGYMGFGMRKEVYTRKPKTSFGQMKKIYGDHLEDFHKRKHPAHEWSGRDKAEFRKFITKKIKRNNVQEGLFNYIIFLAIAAVIGVAIFIALV